MEDQFEYLTKSLKLCSDHPRQFLVNISPSVWSKCSRIVKQIKTDDDTFTILQEYYIEMYRGYLENIFRQFWIDFSSQLKSYNNPFSHHRYIFENIKNLYDYVSDWFENKLIDALFEDPFENEQNPNIFVQNKAKFISKLHQILFTALLADMPLIFSNFLFNTFEFSFKFLDSVVDLEKNGHRSLECDICQYKKIQHDCKCFCDTISDGFLKFLSILRKMGIFDQLCNDIIKSVLYGAIEKYVSNLCKEKKFDVSCLTKTCSWLEENVILWMKIIYMNQQTSQTMMEAILHEQEVNKSELMKMKSSDKGLSNLYFKNVSLNFFGKIQNLNLNCIRNFTVNTYINCRMKQLFDIIIDYPFSEPTLEDLHECIKLEPFYREKFTQSLKTALETRLLHAGVPTVDIIDSYCTAIRALKLLDPQGIILQIVCDPVRNYLRTRDDTVRCIITILTNDSLSNLNTPTDESKLKENSTEDEFIYATWNTWKPQTIGVSRQNKDLINSDIISMLINIFDSKDLFVQEYQRLLAQKLILNPDINLEFEIRNLEILSLRFGESDLHSCEVMLKDLKDSDRINNRISSCEFENVQSKEFKMNGLILSEQFWPENLGFTSNEFKNFKLPPEVGEAFDSYKKAFETVKANRTLNWVYQLGTVKLEIEFKNGTQEYSVRPLQAAIIHLFQKQNIWKISALVQELDISPSILRRNISFWKNIGVLKECSEVDDAFEIVEDGPASSFKQNNRSSLNSQEIDMFIEEEEKNTEEKNDNNLQIFWNFIDNMLKNLHALPLDRIYSMLKMFNMQSPEIENLSMHELRQFLDRKVFERKLIFTNGTYDLNPDTES